MRLEIESFAEDFDPRFFCGQELTGYGPRLWL
jgi:hypothetical protein